MKKKIIKNILILLIMALLLAGCSTKEKKQSMDNLNSDSDDSNSEENSDESNSEESIQEEPDDNQDTESNDQESTGEVQTDLEYSEKNEVYTWNEISVQIPKSWEGKYEVKETENGFYFLQTASNKVSEGLGYLIGIFKSDEMSSDEAGNTMVAFTDEDIYSFQEPTDVNCDYENETTRTEYLSMMEDLDVIKNSIHIDKDKVQRAEEYIFPKSDVWEIPDSLLYNADENDLWIARNEIFARHGREFTNFFLNSYFECCTWYTASVKPDDFDEDKLSQIEKNNLNKIKNRESELEKSNPYPIRYDIGKEFKEDLNGDGSAEKIKFEFLKIKGQDDYTGYLTINGEKYDVLDGNDGCFMNPNTDGIYITDIFSSFPGLEIAIMDYGPSDDLSTYFYTYSDKITFIGQIDGFPFKEYLGIDGFANEGGVIGLQRADVISTCYAYTYWWYDQEKQKLELQDTGMKRMNVGDACNHELYIDIPVYTSPDEESSKIIMKAQKDVSFIETDGENWIRLLGSDGTSGYMKCKDEKIEGTDLKPDQVFSNIFYYD